MTKLYFVLIVIAIIWLIYRALTKSKNGKSSYQQNRTYGKPESMGDLATMFLFAEMINKNTLPPVVKQQSVSTTLPPNPAPRRRRLAAKRKQLTKKQKSMLFRKYDSSCALCRVYLGDQLWNCIWDHKIPLAAAKFRDYSSEYLNRPDNFRPLCSKCSAHAGLISQDISY